MNASIALRKTPVSETSLSASRPDGYEQYSAALFQGPDRVAIVVQPGLYTMALHRLSSQRFFHEPETFIYASQHMATLCGFDGWLPVFDVFNVEAEALGQALVWREGMEPWADRDNPLLRERSDLDRLAPPVPGRSGRMPFAIEVYRRFAEITGVAPVCLCCSPFTLAALLRGFKPLVMDMYRDAGLRGPPAEVPDPGGRRAVGALSGRGDRSLHHRDVRSDGHPACPVPIAAPPLLPEPCPGCNPGSQLTILHSARWPRQPMRGTDRRCQPDDGRQASRHSPGAAARRASRADRGRCMSGTGGRAGRRPVWLADAPYPRRHARRARSSRGRGSQAVRPLPDRGAVTATGIPQPWSVPFPKERVPTGLTMPVTKPSCA